MRFISSNKELKREFKRLIDEYTEFWWASAWADGHDFEFYKQLKNNRSKIRKIVIGTSFKRTDPEFIMEFMNESGVRFDKRENGVFHPKVYLFKNGEKWELIIGSANFTRGAFNTNRELSLLINSNDEDDKDRSFSNLITNEIDNYWKEASYFTDVQLEEYVEAHKKMIKANRDISRNSFVKINRKTSWSEYLNIIKSGHYFKERMSLLQIARDEFKQYSHFENMDTDTRKRIAGYVKGGKGNIDWMTFGNTRIVREFTHKVKDDPQGISEALDEIPLTGDVNKGHYDAFIAKFEPIFSRNEVTAASRLLAIKRPDVFFCKTGRNSDRLFICYPTRNYVNDYNGYWKDVAMKIHESDWWKGVKPADPSEGKIWNNRVALLDAVYYVE